MRSDNVNKGMQQAPHRSLFNALGFTAEEMRKPMVGIVNGYNEIVPGHMNLDKLTQAAKLGVAEAGGMPVEFPAIAVCDGIAMGHIGMKYSLVTRDLIADSIEAMALAHQFDALVMIPNCDKTVPGMLMAAARLNIPTVFVSGGPGDGEVPDVTGMSILEANRLVRACGLQMRINGGGLAVSQLPAPDENVNPSTLVTVTFQPPGTVDLSKSILEESG